MPPCPSWRTIRYRPCRTVSGVSILAIIHEPCNPRSSVARYAREQKPPQPRDHRRWTTQTAPSENLDSRRRCSVVILAFANRFDLYLGTVVRFARLLVSLLVRLQSQTRPFLRLGGADCTVAKRDVSALPAALRSLCIRTTDDHSQQPAFSVFAGEIHQAARLVNRGIRRTRLRLPAQRALAPVRALLEPASNERLRSDLRQVAGLLSVFAAALRSAELVAVRRDLHHPVRRSRLLAAWATANRAQAKRALVVRGCLSRCLLRARSLSPRRELAHVSFTLPFPLGRSRNLFRRHLH